MPVEGLNQLRAALRSLPADLAHEAGQIVQRAAEEAKAQIENAYPEGPTGNLKRGVTIAHEQAGPFAAVSIVRSRARHAWMYEHGTVPRHTSHGANRGRMPKPPPSRQMIPIVVRARARMTNALMDLVRRAGFQVSG